MSATPNIANRRSRFALAGAVALVLGLAACSPAASSPEASGPEPSSPAASSPAESVAGGGGTDADHVITISGLSFEPSSLTIAAGESVAFENSGSTHRIVEGVEGAPAADPTFEALELGSGDVSDAITFSEPGSYPITCTLHPSMQMTIIVE
jgi:plastocyanin